MPFAELRPLCASPPRSRPEISVEPSGAADLLAIHETISGGAQQILSRVVCIRLNPSSILWKNVLRVDV
jgi:hypothetical protein